MKTKNVTYKNKKNQLMVYPGVTHLEATEEDVQHGVPWLPTYKPKYVGELLPLPKPIRATKWKRWYDEKTGTWQFQLR